MIRHDTAQLSLSLRGWCKGCMAYDICGAQDTECYPFRHYDNEVLRPDHPEPLSWITQVRGFGFADVVAQPIPSFTLPAYVPQIDSGGCEYVGAADLDFIALTLSDVFSRTELRSVAKGDIREKLRLPRATKVMLLAIGKDELIERMWGQQTHIYEAIVAFNFDLVTAVNYSIWYNEPRLEHLLNLKRSLLTFEGLQKHGVPVIPHIYWYNESDLRRWADWLSRNRVPMIAINLQTARQKVVWEHLLAGIGWMGQHFPRHVRYLIIGPSTADRIKRIRSCLQEVTFCNKDAYVLAAKRRYKTWNGEEFGKVHWDTEPAIILRHNVALISRVAEGNPPPAFTLLDGASPTIMEQLPLPGVFTGIEEHSEQLRLLAP